jgi:hypothetical protein
MQAETETRWIVLGTDGRHVSLGRTEPSEAEVMAASDALVAQGLSGWLALLEGDYYNRRKVTLEPLQRIGAAHDADWQAALASFHAARHRAITLARGAFARGVRRGCGRVGWGCPPPLA